MIYGVDLASYQGQPNFDQLKSDGKSFAFIKATQGTGYVSPTYEYDVTNARRVGMVVCHYHFAANLDPVAEANYFCDHLDLQDGEPVALDLEVPVADKVGYAVAFVDQVKKRLGFVPMFYSYQSYINALPASAWKPLLDRNVGLWLANPDNNPNTTPATYWPFVAIKQYGEAPIQGVAGNVDLDVFYGPAESLRKYGRNAGSPVATPAPAPQPPVTPAPAPAPEGANYVVKRGETLSGIASAHGLSLDQIEKLNPQITNPNVIYAGQVIHINGQAPVHNSYTVHAGDSLSGIASHYGVTWQRLLQLNPQITNANLIYPGQVINVP